MDKDGRVSHLFKEVRKHVQPKTTVLRLLEIVSNKVYRVIPEDHPLEQLVPQTQRTYRVEVMPTGGHFHLFLMLYVVLVSAALFI